MTSRSLALSLVLLGVSVQGESAGAEVPAPACTSTGKAYVVWSFPAAGVDADDVKKVINGLSHDDLPPFTVVNCDDPAMAEKLTSRRDLQDLMDRMVFLAIDTAGKDVVHHILPFLLERGDSTLPTVKDACAVGAQATGVEQYRERLRAYWSAAVALYEMGRLKTHADLCRARAAKHLFNIALEALGRPIVAAGQDGPAESELRQHLQRRCRELQGTIRRLEKAGTVCARQGGPSAASLDQLTLDRSSARDRDDGCVR